MTKKDKKHKKKLKENKPAFKPPSNFRGKTFKPSNKQGFNASRFRVQHKG